MDEVGRCAFGKQRWVTRCTRRNYGSIVAQFLTREYIPTETLSIGHSQTVFAENCGIQHRICEIRSATMFVDQHGKSKHRAFGIL